MTDQSAPLKGHDDLPAAPEQPPVGQLLTPMSVERRRAELLELAETLPAESDD